MVTKGEIDVFKRLTTGFIFLIVVGFLLGACNSKTSEVGKTDDHNEVVATVNGEKILKKDYDTQLELTKATYEQQGMAIEDLDTKAKEEMEKTVLDQLINTELLLQTAQNEGITVEGKEINAEFDKVKSQFKDDQQFKEALKKNKVTEETLKDEIKNQLVIKKSIDRSIGEISVSEEEVKTMYDQYKEQMASVKQEPEAFDTMKSQLEQQVIAQKKSEKVMTMIEDLRKENEKNIEILI